MERVYEEKKDCYGCSACYNICPTDTITMKPDLEGFLYPVIGDNCIDCNRCRNVCPNLKDDHYKEENIAEFYVAKHKSKDVLMNSTSGGLFTALSDVVLHKGGLVYGVDFDDDFKVLHKRAENEAERNRMRFSKYVQSNLTNVFQEIKNDLKDGRIILFTGTPCQTAGLRGYLGKESKNENLYICDIICHSIPSPLIWEEYKGLLEKEHNSTLTHIQFRSKIINWTRENSNKAFLYKVKDSDEIYNDERYYKLYFGEKTITRPSCGDCNFTDIHRASDITIADYWGIEKYAPEWLDLKGVSVVLVNTDKGRDLLNESRHNIYFEKRPMEESLNEQQRLKEPVELPEHRDKFWEDYRKYGFEYIIENLNK